MNIFETEYRICTDAYAGYEVQHKYWFWPFWLASGQHSTLTNTFRSSEMAEEYALTLKKKTPKQKVVKYI